jgi:hypothetical protein
MPHIVIEEAGDLQAVYQAFTPILQRTGGEILKVQEFYLSIRKVIMGRPIFNSTCNQRLIQYEQEAQL